MIPSQRIKKIFSQSSDDIDVIVIKNASSPFIDSTFFYATGLTKGLFEGCTALLFPSGELKLLVSSLEQPLVPESIDSISYSSRTDYSDQLQEILSDCKNIGVNASSLIYDDYLELKKIFPNHDFSSISSAIRISRMIKDMDEITHIRKACQIADKVMAEIPSFFTSSLTENQLASEIEYHLKKYGASAPAFETISSFGSNTAKPHYSSGERTIKQGDFIICDFGATVNHYHSDITRTFVYGSASELQKKIHKTVLDAQEQALQTIKPDIAANTIHHMAKQIIDESEFKGFFIHSTGHSLGLDVHDPGIGFSDSFESPLRPGMVLTVEPGIYIPDVGGVRIEDDILVTPEGYMQLTSSAKNLIEIPIK